MEAVSGDDAISKVNGKDHLYHLLLTDVVMPGVSGRILAEKLKSHNDSIKVLCMSGTTDNAILRHQVLEPGIHVITKPFSPDELIKKIYEVLQSGK